MDCQILGVFFASSLLLAAAPGPDNIFVLAQSALHGARAGMIVVLGLCTGLGLHTVLVTVGVSALIAAQPLLFAIIKIGGALYLLWLASLAWRAVPGVEPAASMLPSSRALYLRGIIMNVSNPKVIIFFLAFFPQFLPPATAPGAVTVQMLAQGLLFILATLLVFSGVALLAGQLKNLLRNPGFELYLNKSAAVLLAVLAVTALLA